jgi:hypothetical protein
MWSLLAHREKNMPVAMTKRGALLYPHNKVRWVYWNHLSVCPEISPKVLGRFQRNLVHIISTRGSCAPDIYFTVRSFLTVIPLF